MNPNGLFVLSFLFFLGCNAVPQNEGIFSTLGKEKSIGYLLNNQFKGNAYYDPSVQDPYAKGKMEAIKGLLRNKMSTKIYSIDKTKKYFLAKSNFPSRKGNSISLIEKESDGSFFEYYGEKNSVAYQINDGVMTFSAINKSIPLAELELKKQNEKTSGADEIIGVWRGISKMGPYSLTIDPIDITNFDIIISHLAKDNVESLDGSIPMKWNSGIFTFKDDRSNFEFLLRPGSLVFSKGHSQYDNLVLTLRVDGNPKSDISSFLRKFDSDQEILNPQITVKNIEELYW